MKKTRTALITGTVLTLGLVAGCGGGEDQEPAHGDGKSDPSATASAGAGGPVYGGERVPGLAAKPAWSMAQDGDAPYNCGGDAAVAHDQQDEQGVCVVGDAFLLVQDLSAPVAEGETEPQTARFVAHLYDAATGKERTSFTVKCGYDPTGDYTPARDTQVQVGEWKDGSPAVLIRDCRNTEAGGLKKATVKTAYTMYAPSGAKLGSSAYTGEENAELPVVRGHVLLPEASSYTDTRTFAPIGGGKNLELPAETVETAPVGTGQGYAVDAEVATGSLAVIDRSTGRTAWSSADATPPADVARQLKGGDEADASLYPLAGDRAIVIWSASGSDEGVVTTADLATGRILATGPHVTLDMLPQQSPPVVSPDGKTAVLQYAGGAVAWDPQTGDELWRQKADEKDIEPRSITPGGILYAALDGTENAVLDARTKKLLSTGSAAADVPGEFTSDGHTLVHADNGLFAFAAQKA
ncbi:PQQ-binding-like beta-propeller repeat protein [Streptomyces sp. NPDC048751]|uniref:outer membrane protein assembly factor BamB family protein n=1 Tax=Streptomyces sp. NPDC048751 TaxID=3365591 RepID=UPI00371ED163